MKPSCMLKCRVMVSFLLLVVVSGIPSVVHAAKAEDYAATVGFFKKAPSVQPFFKNAYGYAVFPTIGKGGLGVGASYGKGKVYRQGSVTGMASVLKLSVGWQAGGQAFSEIIFFKDKRAYDDFTSGQFEFDAEASAIAIAAGVDAKAGSQGSTASSSAGQTPKIQAAQYRKGMAVFVHQKGGLMYEASIGGQKFGFTPVKKQ